VTADAVRVTVRQSRDGPGGAGDAAPQPGRGRLRPPEGGAAGCATPGARGAEASDTLTS